MGGKQQMRKKIFWRKTCAVAIIAVPGSLLLTACGSDSSVANNNTQTTVASTTASTTTSVSDSTTEAMESYPIVTIDKSRINERSQNKYKNHKLAEEFSEDRTWVYYLDDSETLNYGLIDTSGNVLWNVSDNEVNYCIRTTPVQSGVTCVYNNEYIYDDDFYGKNDVSGFTILDKDGSELYVSNETESEKHYMLGQYNDTFIVGKHAENFSDNVMTIYRIDKNGNKITSEVEYDFMRYNYGSVSGVKEFIHIKDNLFAEKYNSYTMPLLNVDTMEFTEGYSYLYDVHSGENLHSNVTPEKSGSSFYEEYGYCDKDDNLVVKLPSFGDKVKLSGVSEFSGGYAAIGLKGADDKTYVTVIDKEGKQQYEPIKVDGIVYKEFPTYNWSGDERIASASGYVFVTINDETKAISPKGKILTLGTDDLSGIGKDAYIFELLSDGFINTADLLQYKNTTSLYPLPCVYKGYLSLDGKNEIKKVVVKRI